MGCIKVKDLWLHPRTSLSVRRGQYISIIVHIMAFHFLSFGQDVISYGHAAVK